MYLFIMVYFLISCNIIAVNTEEVDLKIDVDLKDMLTL